MADLTGGFDEGREFLLPDPPDDLEMRESVNSWIWDDGDEFGFPRIGVEAVGDHWDSHEIQLNVSFKGGRILNDFGQHKSHDVTGGDGRPRILGTGPLSYELIEPFQHWRMSFDGLATETSLQAQIDGWIPGFSGGDQVPVAIDIDIRSAAPPWECGTLLEEAGRVLATQEEGDAMGGPRFEQLFRATGTFRVDGREHPISGGGLRVRRSGVRRLTTFRGHVWMSAVFPSGRAFGLNRYPDRDDGKPTFNEGYLYEGDGELIPARVVQAPWLSQLTTEREDLSVVLETASGTTTIEGTTILPTYMVMPDGVGDDLRLQQTIIGYTWDGETANGMLERSLPKSRLGTL
jgi:hypothetical protein